MRIGPKKVAQLVSTDPFLMVIVDESTGTEIELHKGEANALYLALLHFREHMPSSLPHV